MHRQRDDVARRDWPSEARQRDPCGPALVTRAFAALWPLDTGGGADWWPVHRLARAARQVRDERVERLRPVAVVRHQVGHRRHLADDLERPGEHVEARVSRPGVGGDAVFVHPPRLDLVSGGRAGSSLAKARRSCARRNLQRFVPLPLFRVDLTGASLDGANLTSTAGLTQAQIDAAQGDADTRLPDGLTRPAAWTTPPP